MTRSMIDNTVHGKAHEHDACCVTRSRMLLHERLTRQDSRCRSLVNRNVGNACGHRSTADVFQLSWACKYDRVASAYWMKRPICATCMLLPTKEPTSFGCNSASTRGGI